MAASSSSSLAAAPVSNLQFWGAVAAAFVLSLLVMLACAYAWVYIYSVLIYSAGDQAYYEAYAQVASPVVAVTVAWPVFFAVGRFMRRFGRRALFAAMAVVVINLTMDAAVLLSVSRDADGAMAHLVLMSLFSALGKLGGAYFGASAPGKDGP